MARDFENTARPSGDVRETLVCIRITDVMMFKREKGGFY